MLFAKGFRERSHRALLAALRLLYSGKTIDSMLEDFSEAMTLRERADYGLVYDEDSARIAIEDAESFVEESAKLLVRSVTTLRAAPRGRRGKRR